jgi:hypothetical protein
MMSAKAAKDDSPESATVTGPEHETARDTPASVPAADGGAIELPVDFCPVCSSRLKSRRCKMVCPRCGYFMSCSEFE